MRKKTMWMYTAILTICGATMLSSCSENVDNPVDNSVNTERAIFEKQLSTTLEQAAAKQQNMESTTHAAKVLTDFIENLNMKALSDQLFTAMADILPNSELVKFAELGDRESEARTALKNTFNNTPDSPEFLLVDAQKALSGLRITFTEGDKNMKYERGTGEDLVVAYLNPATGEGTQLKLNFDNPLDGVNMFVARISKTFPVAIKLPSAVNLTVSRIINGEAQDAMNGLVMLSSPIGQKYISLKKCEWDLTVMIGTTLENRFELPAARIRQHANGAIDAVATILADDTEVATLTLNTNGDPYSEAEMEDLKEMRQDGDAFAAFYEVLSFFNNRSGSGQLTLMSDLEFNVEVKDFAKMASAFGKSIKLRREGTPTKADMDPLVDEMNESVTFTVLQKSTGISAECKLMTAIINDRNTPALSLRFKGETDFQVMNYNLTDADRENYNALMHSFDAPGRQLRDLFNAIIKKRNEFNEVNPFKSK